MHDPLCMSFIHTLKISGFGDFMGELLINPLRTMRMIKNNENETVLVKKQAGTCVGCEADTG